MNSVARLAAVSCSPGKISRNSTPNSTPAKMPAASVPSRVLSETPRSRAQIRMMINAPIERTVAWIKGGISGSASFTVTWLRPHESVRPSMIRVATASSGREVLLLFTISPRRGRKPESVARCL